VISDPENTRGKRYRFGDYILDISEHSLKCSGRDIVLRPKSFETLAFLVERHGRLVTKDEVLGTVWAGVVVTDGNLTHCIEEIRNAMGDDPHEPLFIQTVPRVGYRFIADVVTSTRNDLEEIDVEEEEFEAIRVKFSSEPGRFTGNGFSAGGALRPVTVVSGRWRRTLVIAAPMVVIVVVAVWLVFFRHGAGEAITSLAVLPFENLSGMTEEEYFADGLTDALISDIAQFSKLRVISRTSVMQYKANPRPLNQIGRDLQVDAVVEGSVFRSGNRVRISAALISTRGEKRLWTETYELDQSDLLTLIRTMAGTLAGEIRIELTAAEHSQLMKNTSVQASVYEQYLKGRFHWGKRTLDGFRKGIECFDRAIAADSTFALAYAGLADCYNMMGDYDFLPPSASFPKARSAALQALAIDSALAEAHASLGFSVMHYDWHWEEVEREYNRAIALNPNCANAHHWYALFLAMHGRFPEAREEIRRARILDPLSAIICSNQAWVAYFAGDFEEAVDVCREALQMDSNFVSARVKLGWAYEQLKLFEDADAEFRKTLAAVGSDPNSILLVAHTNALRGRREDAVRMMQGTIEESRRVFVSEYHIAAVCAALGDNRAATEWLRKAYEQRSGWLAWLKVDPKFRGLRGEPRYEALLDSLGMGGAER
jgi:TolB-like protein/DNA-binding winged helix-turn-helix (wHTH) protein/Flp pilus assembly protein TadD